MSVGKDMNALEHDSDRFLDASKLAQMARGLTPEEFVTNNPTPALFLESVEGDATPTPSSSKGTARELSIKRTIVKDERGAAAAYDERAVFVTKRPGNPFPQMFSIGRAMNNDIVLLLETISKMHGYLWRDGDKWSYTDHKSTNGTLVNGVVMQSGEKRVLKDGDVIRLGLDLRATFLLPRSLYDRIHGAS